MLSVLVPTYCRSATLPAALESLMRQTTADFEVVVVDNAADAAVAALVDGVAASAIMPVRYVPEPRLGLHHARHAAARAARGDVLVYIDDDVTLDPGFVAAYADAFASHPEMAAAGGPLLPDWEAPPPAWLVDHIGDRLTSGLPLLSLMKPHDAFVLSPRGFFYGANMAIRREVLFALGGFHPEIIGTQWVGDGESGLNHKLWAVGHLVGYVPTAVAHHRVPAARMTPAYLRRRMASEAACALYTRFRRDGLPARGALLAEAAAEAARHAKFLVASPLLGERTDPRSLFIRVRAAEAATRVRYLWRLVTDPQLREWVARPAWLSPDEPAPG